MRAASQVLESIRRHPGGHGEARCSLEMLGHGLVTAGPGL